MTSNEISPVAQGRASAGQWRRLLARRKLLLPARALAWVSMATIAVLSLVPGEMRPHSFMPGPAEHALAYGVAGFFVALGYPSTRQRLLGGLIFALASGLFELLQHFSPGRSPSGFDALASTSGLTLGIILGAAQLLRIPDCRETDTQV